MVFTPFPWRVNGRFPFISSDRERCNGRSSDQMSVHSICHWLKHFFLRKCIYDIYVFFTVSYKSREIIGYLCIPRVRPEHWIQRPLSRSLTWIPSTKQTYPAAQVFALFCFFFLWFPIKTFLWYYNIWYRPKWRHVALFLKVGEGEGVVHASAEYTANQHIFATSFRDLITGKF